MGVIETVKIRDEYFGHIIINKSDFNPAEHVLYEEPAESQDQQDPKGSAPAEPSAPADSEEPANEPAPAELSEGRKPGKKK